MNTTIQFLIRSEVQQRKMHDLCYDMRDIEEQEEYEKYRCDKADVLGWLCEQRGIKLWENHQK